MASIRIVALYSAFLTAACTVIAVVDNHASASSDCLGCHVGEFAYLSRHFCESNDDCRVCHRVSGKATGHPQLDTTHPGLCVSCHVEANVSLSATEHHALACTSCHDPHGSEFDHNHLAEHDALCLSACHTASQLGRSHPRGPGTRDSATGHELTCVLACHSNHSSAYPKLLQRDRYILCARCHADKY